MKLRVYYDRFTIQMTNIHVPEIPFISVLSSLRDMYLHEIRAHPSHFSQPLCPFLNQTFFVLCDSEVHLTNCRAKKETH